MDQDGRFANSLDDFLKKSSLGKVIGGGTLLTETGGEVKSFDIAIEVNTFNQDVWKEIKEFLEGKGAPKGSVMGNVATDTEIPFGVNEGLALYLNGTELEASVYEQSNTDHVYEEIDRMLGDAGAAYGFWQGSTETAFYFYGRSFDEMKSLMQTFLDTYPLCQKCRVVQIV